MKKALETKTTKKKEQLAATTFKIGTYEIDILNQNDDLIPAHTEEILVTDHHAEALALSVLYDLPTLLIGETGTGKTSIVRLLAFKRQQGYTRINMHGYNTPDELIGSKSVKNGATYYENGILTNAMLRGHIVVLDEINATPPDCTFIIHGLLDDDKRVALPNGDVIRPHKDFRFYATMNPDYEGTRTLNRAFMDRFAIVLNVDILLPDQEKKLLHERTGVKPTIAEKMVNLAWMGRKAYRESKTMMMISTRTLLQWAHLMQQGIKPQQAYEISVLNKAHADEREAFKDFYQIVFQSKPDSREARQILQFVTRGELMDWKSDLEQARTVAQQLNQEKQNILRELDTERQKKGVDPALHEALTKKVNDYEELFKQMQQKMNF